MCSQTTVCLCVYSPRSLAMVFVKDTVQTGQRLRAELSPQRIGQKELANCTWFCCSWNFECDVLKLTLSSSVLPCPPVFPSTYLPSLLSTPILTDRLCRTWPWNASDDLCWDIIAGSCTLRSPNSGVKLPLLVPYFLWKQRLPPPPAPAVLTVRLHQDHPSLLCIIRSG